MAKQNFIKRIISSPIVQTFLVYVSGSWIALELTDYIIDKYNLNEKISDVLPIILLTGLPVAIFLAWNLSREKEEPKETAPDSASEKKSQRFFSYLGKKPWFSIPVVIVLILLILTGTRFIHRRVRMNWAVKEAIPQMEMLLDDGDRVKAFELRQKAKKYLHDNPEFLSLDSRITRKFTILTNPPGAKVYCKEYLDVEGEWKLLGTTPVLGIEMPELTMYRWKFEKPEYEVIYAAYPTTRIDTLFRTMHKTRIIPEGMVYVEGINRQIDRNFLSKDKNGFFVDKYEVTNKEYKEFMDHGAYQDPKYWHNEFILNNEILSFKEAMDYFRDATGRPGPATWEAGDYPDGQENYPVSGISWYEASAYAAYVGKSLPTLAHWRSAAGFEIDPYNYFLGSDLVPLSNMKGTGVKPVGSNPGVNCFGTFDMSGNVREWGLNESPEGRIVQGGAWDDFGYLSVRLSQLPAFNRSPKNGFRCVVYPEKEQIAEKLFQPIEIRDYKSETPASEMEFQIYKKQFLYDKKNLNAHIEFRDETPADWTLEKISFDAAYEQERMIAYLFLPKETIPPFQTVIFFPGRGAQELDSIHEFDWFLSYIVKNGRAVMYPVYKGTYQRRDGTCDPQPSYQSHQYTECQVKWVKDFSRSVDYLETRNEIDTASLAFFGLSWGAHQGAIIPAVEDRIKISMLLIGGLRKEKILSEVDPINYVPHIKIPVLMLNGKYDFIFPFKTSVQPMFDLLGTPEQDKRLVAYDDGHRVPRQIMIKEVLDWLDKYFGAVQKTSANE